MSELVPIGQQELAAASAGGVDLNALLAQMQAMKSANMGGAAPGYDAKGKTKIDLNKNGTFSFTSPFDGKSYGGKTLTVAVVNAPFGLERWPGEGEVIPGRSEDAKGPVCKSIWYTDATTKARSKNGMFARPAWSPFHAVKMLPDLHGSAGHDGLQGETACATCPYAQKGAKGHCKPVGNMEIVIFAVGDDALPQPVYGYVKLSQVNVIQYDNYLQELEKIYKIELAQLAITKLEALKISDKGKVYAKIQFYALNQINPTSPKGQQAFAVINKAVADTKAILDTAAEDGKAAQQLSAAPAGGVPAGDAASGDNPPF